jgi:hypothetical protein
MAISDRQFPVVQHNHSSGTFVGGDLFNIETMDEETRAAVMRIAVHAPQVAALLGKASTTG